jgi:hypothetical protein
MERQFGPTSVYTHMEHLAEQRVEFIRECALQNAAHNGLESIA